MTANNHLLHLQAGTGFPIAAMEQGSIRDKAIRFYWDIFLLLNKDPQNADPSRVFKLSFEDDFDDDLDKEFQEDDFFGDDAFLPRKDLFQEEDGLFEEGEGRGLGVRNELFYK
jgi:hypothetical protein